MQDVPVLKYSEAEAVGEELRSRWASITGQQPAEGLSWPDLVQFVLRCARDRAGMREA